MTQADSSVTSMVSPWGPDLLPDDPLWANLMWQYRVQHWTKSQRRLLARGYVQLRRDLQTSETMWVGQYSDALANLIISLSPRP